MHPVVSVCVCAMRCDAMRCTAMGEALAAIHWKSARSDGFCIQEVLFGNVLSAGLGQVR